MSITIEYKNQDLKAKYPKTYVLNRSIWNVRNELGMTATAFGKVVGFSQSYIVLLETGNRRVNQDIIESICNYLKIDLSQYMIRYILLPD